MATRFTNPRDTQGPGRLRWRAQVQCQFTVPQPGPTHPPSPGQFAIVHGPAALARSHAGGSPENEYNPYRHLGARRASPPLWHAGDAISSSFLRAFSCFLHGSWRRIPAVNRGQFSRPKRGFIKHHFGRPARTLLHAKTWMGGHSTVHPQNSFATAGLEGPCTASPATGGENEYVLGDLPNGENRRPLSVPHSNDPGRGLQLAGTAPEVSYVLAVFFFNRTSESKKMDGQ